MDRKMGMDGLEDRWRQAQLLEARRELGAARDAYAGILSSHPNQFMVRLRLSELEQRSGRYRAARVQAMLALETVCATKRWEGLPHATLRLLAFDEHELIRDAISQADWGDPRLVTQVATLSQHLSLSGHDDDALRMLDGATRRLQPSHLVEFARGNVLRHLGRLDDATDAYEKAIALAPGYAFAHWALAYHAPAATPGARVPRITRALQQAGNDHVARAHLDYALFKELDAAGDHAAAWTSLADGMDSVRRLVPYDAELEQEGLERLQRAGRGRPAVAGSTQGRVPIFIVGMPRTGTTVVERILGGHEQVADGGELNDFQCALSHAADRFVRLPMTAADVDALAAVDLAAVGSDYLGRTAYRYGGRQCLVDKNPRNVFAAGLIASALPHAKILCMMRNPMDACFSNLKELFAGDAYGYSYDIAGVAGHYDRFARISAHWEATMPVQYKVVRYEELVAEPGRVGEEIMRFCGLPYDPRCIDISSNDAPVSTASSSQVREPIHARGVGAWKKYRTQLQPLAAALSSRGHAVD